MSGDLKIRRHLALELVAELRRDVIKAVEKSAAQGELPTGPNGWKEWAARQEGKLALLEAYGEELRKRDVAEVIAVAEGTAV